VSVREDRANTVAHKGILGGPGPLRLPKAVGLYPRFEGGGRRRT